jgi:RNA-directed DNA polymerase
VHFPGVHSSKTGAVVGGEPNLLADLFEVDELASDLSKLDHLDHRPAMHDPIAKTGAWIKRMLQGHLSYFAVSGNRPSLWWLFNEVRRLWLMSLRRRSQAARLSLEKFIRLIARFVPPIKTLHPLPCHRFDAKTRGRSPVR